MCDDDDVFVCVCCDVCDDVKRDGDDVMCVCDVFED